MGAPATPTLTLQEQMNKTLGMPPGVDVVRLGLPAQDEFEIVDGKIYQGPRISAASGVVVQPSQGWSFRYDIRNLCYVAVKSLDRPITIGATMRFSVSTTLDKQTVEDSLAALAKIPGYLDITKNEE